MPETTTSERPQSALPLILFAESPVHAGAGGTRESIDLPIQRSVQTCWPIVNDSTQRGGFSRMRGLGEDARKMFGTGELAGTFSTPDAELLLFPVEAPKGITAWVTCLLAFQRFVRKLDICDGFIVDTATTAVADLKSAVAGLGEGPGTGEAWLPTDSAIKWAVEGGQRAIVSADAFQVPAVHGPAKKSTAEAMDTLRTWVATHLVPFDAFWQAFVGKRLILVTEAAFTHYTLERTDVRTRNVVSEGVAQANNLWSEENLPVDSVLFTIMTRTDRPSDAQPNDAASDGEPPEGAAAATQRKTLEDFRQQLVASKHVQLGGDQNLGRGWLRVRALGEA